MEELHFVHLSFTNYKKCTGPKAAAIDSRNVRQTDFVANKHHLMQEEYGSPA